jgi:tetratricopeptide (TPR) repeat protein
MPRPLTVSAPANLNFHDLPWPTFERLLLKLLKDIEDARDVRAYGTPGQSQHGIDLVGFPRDLPATVYQAKDLASFSPTDLRKAVEKYTNGGRPFDAARLVVAVACGTRETKVGDELANLRAKYPDLIIDLWGQDELSDFLQHHPLTVARFFGHETARVFCPGYPTERQPSTAPAQEIAANAISRGPLAHLDLLERVHQANLIQEARPGQAADILATVADRLEASPFLADAAQFRGRQASLLEAAGRYETAAALRLVLGWKFIQMGDQWSAGQQIDKLESYPDEYAADVARPATTLAVAAHFGSERQVTLDHMATVFDKLEAGDPFRFEAALLLAEQAVAWRRLDLISDRLESLNALAAERPVDELSQTSAVRLHMCLADATGKWQSLVRDAKRSYRPALHAWVLARRARYLVLADQPQQAVESWEDAIFFATADGFNSDAGDWLYSERAVHGKYGRSLEMRVSDINDYHRRAQALRATGSRSMLPRPYPLRERALNRLSDEKWADTLEALHEYLRHSVVLGDWVDELTCHELFGDLFRATERPAEAVTHYVRCGMIDKVKDIAAHLPEASVTIPTGILVGPPWERAAAYRFVAGATDLVADDNAREWLDQAMTEVLSSAESQWSVSGDPWYAAFSVMAAFADLSTETQARQILAMARGYLDRGPGTYRHTDSDQVTALLRIAHAHTDLASEAFALLCQGLLIEGHELGQRFVRDGGALLREHPLEATEHLADAARSGNFIAALALLVAGADSEPVLAVAHQQYEKAIAPREHQPGVWGIGSDTQAVAIFVVTLGTAEITRFATAMIARAGDQHEAVIDRESALHAVMTIAKRLPDPERDQTFEAMMKFAAGEYQPSTVDQVLPDASDPFSRFRIDFGDISLLKIAGIEAAAAAARTPEQFIAVQRVADMTFPTVDGPLRENIGRGLSRIPSEHLALDPALAAGHPLPEIRTLAAVKWASSEERDLTLGSRLAVDGSSLVRRSLASALQENHSASVEAILAQDVRRSVRRFIKPTA